MIKVIVNGEEKMISADPSTPLLWALHEELGMSEVREGCGLGQCGLCVVLVNGREMRACVTPLSYVKGQVVCTPRSL